MRNARASAGTFPFGLFAHIPGIIAREGAKSRQNAQDLLAAFDKVAERAGVPHETILEKCTSTDFLSLLLDYAQLRDLTIIPMAEIIRANVPGGGYIRVRQTYHGLAEDFSGHAHSSWEPSLWLGTSAAPPPVRYRTPFLFSKKRERSAWSRLLMKNTWTQSILRKNSQKIWPGTESTWSWTELKQRASRLVAFLNPILCPTRWICL